MFKWTDTISGFPVSRCSAEALHRWDGKTIHHLISYCLSNTSAKNFLHRIVYVKITAGQRWDVLWDTVYTQKMSLPGTLSCYNYDFWCKCWEGKQSKGASFFHVAKLVFLHYLAKCRNIKVAYFHSSAVVIVLPDFNQLLFSLVTLNSCSCCCMTA